MCNGTRKKIVLEEIALDEYFGMYMWHLPMTSVDAKIFRQNPTLPVAFF